MKKLSILICSLDERKDKLKKLTDILNKQTNDNVEILANVDNRTKSVGMKRNELVKEAQGQYVCFIDDDDEIAPNYIPKIMDAIETSPDVVGIERAYHICWSKS